MSASLAGGGGRTGALDGHGDVAESCATVKDAWVGWLVCMCVSVGEEEEEEAGELGHTKCTRATRQKAQLLLEAVC